jgi:hypothetical protein
MLVYGDRSRTADPQERLDALAATARAADAHPPGRARQDRLTAAFIDAGMLAQGLADAEFRARGFDDGSAVQDAAMAVLLALARRLCGEEGPVEAALASLAALPLPGPVELKTPEGYAFYSVYPQAYFAAAAAFDWPEPPLVIGLRSIGTGLAAMVALASQAGDVITLRPTGPPFGREVKVSDVLKARLAAHTGPFAIVDEGPGLSGSSFGAVADLLESLGVTAERMLFLASHAGDPGREAAARHRARWAAARRLFVAFEDLHRDDPVAGWFTDLIGEVEAVDDISGGAWREGRPDHPPVNAAQERRKFRLYTTSGVWLAKFAGLGALGVAKLGRARALHAAGFTPEPLALRGGFLLERWETAPPLQLETLDRPALIAHLGRYLGFRAASFPADDEEAASLDDLRLMTRTNIAQLTGRRPNLDLPASAGRRVHIDARLHRWEWLQRPDGAFLKTDALDHSSGHDLVGSQDIAWDVAGGAIEFGLSPDEGWALAAGVSEAAGRPVDPALIAFFEVCYLAFQAGAWAMAGETTQSDRYLAALQVTAARRRKSWWS